MAISLIIKIGRLIELDRKQENNRRQKNPRAYCDTRTTEKKKTDLKTNIPPILREFEKELKR